MTQGMEPQQVDYKKHYKQWLIESYFLAKEKMITLIALSVVYALVFIGIYNISSTQAFHNLIDGYVFNFVITPCFMFYVIYLFYNADDNKPPLDFSINKYKILEYLKLIFVFIIINIILNAIHSLIAMGAHHPQNHAHHANQIQLAISQVDTSSFLYGLYAYNSNLVMNFMNMFFLCYLFCTLLMNFEFMQATHWIIDALIKKNFTLWLITIVFGIFCSLLQSTVLFVNYIFIIVGPVIMALGYVIIKHINFNLPPKERSLLTAKDKNTLNEKNKVYA